MGVKAPHSGLKWLDRAIPPPGLPCSGLALRGCAAHSRESATFAGTLQPMSSSPCPAGLDDCWRARISATMNAARWSRRCCTDPERAKLCASRGQGSADHGGTGVASGQG